MPNDRTRLPLPDEFLMHPTQGECYTLNQLRAYSDAENAALRERLLKMSDTMKGMDAHEAGLAEAQAYLMARVKVLEDALIAEGHPGKELIAAIRSALAQPQAEPVAWMRPRVGPDPIKWADGHIDFASAGRSPKERFITAGWTPLYASPAAPAPVVPCHIVNIGHRFDGKRQVHIPQLLLEFEPVPIGSPNDAKGWKNRDAMVNLIEASPPAPAVQPQDHGQGGGNG